MRDSKNQRKNTLPMNITQQQVEAGQAVYTKRTLAIYDLLVLGLSNRLIWKCPTPQLITHYNQNVSGNHLDVGVGTGYFLDHCRFPSDTPRVALMDLNPDTLEFASRRVARYLPEIYPQNILEPISFDGNGFDSVQRGFPAENDPSASRALYRPTFFFE